MGTLRGHIKNIIEKSVKYASLYDIYIIPQSIGKVLLSYDKIEMNEKNNNIYVLTIDFGDTVFSYELHFVNDDNKMTLIDII